MYVVEPLCAAFPREGGPALPLYPVANLHGSLSSCGASSRAGSSVCSQVMECLRKSTSPAEDLAERQLKLLRRLESVRELMESLRPKPPTVLQSNLPADIVINVSPECVPRSLLRLRKILELHVTCHTHSSIVALTPEATAFAAELERGNSDRFRMKITLIWKNVGPDAETIATPTTRTILLGEANVLRYLTTAVPSRLSYADSDRFWETDAVLDLCDGLRNSKNSKERDVILGNLSSKLGTRKFMCDDANPGIADIYMFSVCERLRLEKSLTRNLKSWYDSFSKLHML